MLKMSNLFNWFHLNAVHLTNLFLNCSATQVRDSRYCMHTFELYKLNEKGNKYATVTELCSSNSTINIYKKSSHPSECHNNLILIDNLAITYFAPF